MLYLLLFPLLPSPCPLPLMQVCARARLISQLTVPLQQQEGWSVKVTARALEYRHTHTHTQSLCYGGFEEKIENIPRMEEEKGKEKKEGQEQTAWLIPLCKCLHVPLKRCARFTPQTFCILTPTRPCSPTAPSVAFRCDRTRRCFNILHEQQLDHEIAFKQGALGRPQLIQWWQCSTASGVTAFLPCTATPTAEIFNCSYYVGAFAPLQPSGILSSISYYFDNVVLLINSVITTSLTLELPKWKQSLREEGRKRFEKFYCKASCIQYTQVPFLFYELLVFFFVKYERKVLDEKVETNTIRNYD